MRDLHQTPSSNDSYDRHVKNKLADLRVLFHSLDLTILLIITTTSEFTFPGSRMVRSSYWFNIPNQKSSVPIGSDFVYLLSPALVSSTKKNHHLHLPCVMLQLLRISASPSNLGVLELLKLRLLQYTNDILWFFSTCTSSIFLQWNQRAKALWILLLCLKIDYYDHNLWVFYLMPR